MAIIVRPFSIVATLIAMVLELADVLRMARLVHPIPIVAMAIAIQKIFVGVPARRNIVILTSIVAQATVFLFLESGSAVHKGNELSPGGEVAGPAN